MKDIITIGHDAEVFLQNAAGEPVPAIGLVGGTKEEPRKILGGALQEDNVMAEMNIEPATTRDEFSDRTKQVLDQLRQHVRHLGLSVAPYSAAEFKSEQLEHEQAHIFGCLPDYDAWDVAENAPIELDKSNWRYAGGHIHIGLPFRDDPMAVCRYVQRLDLSLGIGMRMLFGESPRAKAYGRWGAHRPTPYGVEYRVPDNTWLFKPATRKWVFDVCEDLARMGDMKPRHSREAIKKYLGFGAEGQESLRSIYRHTTSIKLPSI